MNRSRIIPNSKDDLIDLPLAGGGENFIGTVKNSVIDQPIIVEGYSNQALAADEMVASRSRSLLVAHYLKEHFHLNARNIGLMPLNATAPPFSGKSSWEALASYFSP